MRTLAEQKEMNHMEEEVVEENTKAEAATDTEDMEAEATADAETMQENAAEQAEEACEADDAEDAEEADAEGKSFFKKKAKTDKKQEALKQKIEELEDRVKRQMAEFDNFRKRTEKEKTAMFETGAKSVIEKMLPVVDNFERGLAAIPQEEMGKGYAEGMQMISLLWI